uniref:RNA-directed RNA polymerase n=1 Tax=Xiangshan insect virus TaxID=2886242 RepID=A0A8K1YQM0_9VIRU|nr:MAG: RNA dependent RNA polymerase [Xiangshan insect virus]
MLPPLLSRKTYIPVVCMENLIASINLRVLGPRLSPHLAFSAQSEPLSALVISSQGPFNLTTTLEICKALKLQATMKNRSQKGVQLILSSKCGPTIEAMSEYFWKPMKMGTSLVLRRRRLAITTSLITRSSPSVQQICKRMRLICCGHSNGPTDNPCKTCSTVYRERGMSHRDSPLRDMTMMFMLLDDMNWINKITEPKPFDKWVLGYKGGRRRTLMRAHAASKLLGDGPARLARVRNFVKLEAYNKPGDPRNISPRSDEFLIFIGPYISAIEHAACGASFLIKGLSLEKRREALSWIAEYDTYIEIDYSRFDMTVSEPIMAGVEHTIFKTCFPDDKEFHKFLDACLRVTGRSWLGTYYKVRGTRCSGDAHTSIGNGLINRFLTWICLLTVPSNAWRSVHEGDDGLIGVRHGYGELVMECLDDLKFYGFTIKKKITKNLNEVTFCGRRLVITQKGVMDCCDPIRTMGKFHVTSRDGDIRTLAYAKALSYLHTDSSTPVIGVLAACVERSLRDKVSKGRRLKRAIAATLRDRWLLEGLVHVKDIFKVPKPANVPELLALFCDVTPLTLSQIQQFHNMINSYDYIPHFDPLLLLDEEPIPSDAEIRN